MKNIRYGRQKITDEDIRAVAETLRSDFLTQGPVIPAFEEAVAAFHGARYAVAFANGTAALHGAYYAMGVGSGDEIVTSPVTFAATANAAAYLGGIPRFADMDPKTRCLDVKKTEEALRPETKVIAPVSFGGYPVDLKAFRALANANGSFLLHDAAHAIGSRRNGSFGMEHAHIAILSFHPVKHVAMGEGGMALTNDEALRDKMRLFRSHGITKDPELMEKSDGPWYYEMVDLGFNYRMTDVLASLGMSQFSRIRFNLKTRNRLARDYFEALSELDFLHMPPSVGFDWLKDEGAPDLHAWHLFPVWLENEGRRRRFYDYLHEKKILAQVHYLPVHLQPWYRKKFDCGPGDYPEAERYYKGTVSIPMYHEMEEEERDYIIRTVRAFDRL